MSEGLITGMNASVRAEPIVRKNQVRLYGRTWDGIDQPDYTDIIYLNGAQARALAKQLVEAAKVIEPTPPPTPLWMYSH